MFSCLPLARRRSQRKFKPNEEPVAPVSIYLRTNSGKSISRIAMLWTPQDNPNEDVVSAKVATDLLGLEIQQSEKEMPSINFRGQPLDIKGHVVLQWGLERSRRIHRTRFMVAASEDLPFELVLSRKRAIEYGLVDS